MACKPSRAEPGESLIVTGFDQVVPPSVDRHASRFPSDGRPWACSPVAGAAPPTALTTIAPPISTIRGPRCRPSASTGGSAIAIGFENVRPSSLDRANMTEWPLPNASATIPWTGGKLRLPVGHSLRGGGDARCQQ